MSCRWWRSDAALVFIAKASDCPFAEASLWLVRASAIDKRRPVTLLAAIVKTYRCESSGGGGGEA